MSHPYSGPASHIHANESLPFSPTKRNFGPYGHMRSVVPMGSLASLPAASPRPTEDEGREEPEENTERRVTLWGSEYDLSDTSAGSRISWSAKAAAWGHACNNRIGKAFRIVKRHIVGVRVPRRRPPHN
ncbi:hypothetical protein LshimejAT787_0700450 [Lyophyllum shimeji]|uniref:Uncharacterized protein n=1 Tax=Lyophyllum shimeji TaxID=47721 RepID=A0A9P3UPX5_LYOSH|nr:hypothetical protein LshimejAT787_0700450 [Lyophyllum shimeji]